MKKREWFKTEDSIDLGDIEAQYGDHVWVGDCVSAVIADLGDGIKILYISIDGDLAWEPMYSKVSSAKRGFSRLMNRMYWDCARCE